MKIRDLIQQLLISNDLDDEILVAYWDKGYFLDTNDFDKAQVDKVWEDFIVVGQETLDGLVDFREVGYELADNLDGIIGEKGNNE
jgi:hypothetical protein